MKKFIAALLTGVMTFSLVACGSADAETEVAEVTEAPAEEENAEPEEEAAEEAPAEDAAVEDAAEEETADAEAADAEEKSEGVMTYAEYVAADLETEVVVETYIQAKQAWWEEDGQGKATFYTQDQDGAYFIYDMFCTEEEYEELAVGTKIKVTGYKAEWSGEVEITDASYEIEDGSYVAEALDVTDKLGADDLVDYQNQYVSFKDMTVEAADDSDAAYLYKWDGSGSEGDDLYFNVSSNGQTYTFTVESYLCDSTTDVYKAVKELKVGDTVDMEGFLYWYEGANPHITAVTVK